MSNAIISSSFFVPESKKVALAELNRLPAEERLETIRRGSGRAKYDMLLDARDGARLAPMLHPQEIYLMVSAVGPEFASELLLLASTQQITTLVDLDIWEGDRIDPRSAQQWLTLLLETGEKKLSQTICAMEPELVTLLLKTFIRVTAGPEAYDNDDADGNANRLEGLYDIEYRDEEAAKIVGGILKVLQKEDPQAWMQLLELVRSELDSVLEEEVYQARCNRLLDLGFVPPIEARNLYSQVDPLTFNPAAGKQLDLEADGQQSPMPLLRMAQPGGLLAEVLASGIDHQLATEMCMLANRKLSADLVDPSRDEAVSQSLAQLYDMLNLGLEKLAGQDVDRAAALFRNSYLLHIFQLGHSLVSDLAARARAFVDSPFGNLLDGPFKRFVETLQERPPQLFCGIRVGDPQQPEAIRSLKQLACAESILRQLECQQSLCTELLQLHPESLNELNLQGCNIDLSTELTLSDLFLTALANQLLGENFTPTPIAAEELSVLHELLISEKKLNPELVERIRTQLEEKLPGSSQFGDYCLEIWQEEFGQLEKDQIDPRYLSGLLVKLEG